MRVTVFSYISGESSTKNRHSKQTVCFLIASIVMAMGALVVSPAVSEAAVIGAVKTPSGRCLENKWGVTSDGNPVQIYDCNGSAAQIWSVESDGTVRVQTKCLGPQGGSLAAGTALVISNCTGAAFQNGPPVPEVPFEARSTDSASRIAVVSMQTEIQPSYRYAMAHRRRVGRTPEPS